MALEAGAAYLDVLPLLKNFSKELQKQAQPALAQAGKNLQRAAGPLRTAGRNLTKFVTLPAVLAGGAILKTSIDFGSAMARIAANSNLTGAQLEKFRAQILDLAGKTAQAPVDLANGLYFLASAGLSASQIGKTLEASAKAAAAGMGDAADVAKITANALNAYRGSGLTAVQVTDSLSAAIKAGSAEPDEFAGALGRVLPIASKAKVSFQEITGSLAAMSNIGLDVNEGVTALRGVLQALEAPGTLAAKTLKEVGLSADEVRGAISKDGLVGALDLLDNATHGNIDQMRKIIPNIRALTGFYSLSGDRASAYADALHQTTHAQGALNDAFETTKKQDPAFQWDQLKASAQVLAINLGQKLLPVFQDIVKELGKAVDWFSNLSDAQQENIVKWVALAAVAGPFLRLLSGGLSIIGGAARLMGLFSTATAAAGAEAGVATGAFAGMAGPISLVAGALLLATAWTIKSNREMAKEVDTIKVFGENSKTAAKSVEDLGGKLRELSPAAKEAGDRLDYVSGFQNRFNSGVAEGAKEHDKFITSLTGSKQGLKDYDAVMQKATGVTKGQAKQIASTIGGYEQMGGVLDETRKAQLSNLLVYGDVNGALKLLSGWIKKLPANHHTKFYADNLTGVLAEVRDYRTVLASIPKSITTRFRNARNETGGLAAGGPALPHHSYVVGERGPEMLHMGSRGGVVVPNDQLGGGAGTLVLDGPVMLRLDDGTKFRAYISAIARTAVSDHEDWANGRRRMGGS